MSSSDAHERAGDRLTEIVDRHGFVHARLSWNGDELVELQVPGAIIRGVIVDDPLLGRAHEIVSVAATSDGHALTTISAIEWARPTEIPAIAAPGRLPPGAGGAIMNVLAILAQRAGVTELRYRGPYPTHALFATLARSFRTTTTEGEFTSAFADRASRLARDPMPAVFVPAPHERIAIVTGGIVTGGIERDAASAYGIERDDLSVSGIEPDDASVYDEVRGVTELREGIERVTLDGIVYSRGTGVTRLVEARDIGEIKIAHATQRPQRTSDVRDALDVREARAFVRAEVWFADEHYAHVATFDSDGGLVEGPHPIPACHSDVLGKSFPPQMVAALAELIADHVPEGLARGASNVVVAHRLRWADLGARAAARVGDELHLHAALWAVSKHGMPRLAMALVEALVPIVAPLAARSLTR